MNAMTIKDGISNQTITVTSKEEVIAWFRKTRYPNQRTTDEGWPLFAIMAPGGLKTEGGDIRGCEYLDGQAVTALFVEARDYREFSIGAQRFGLRSNPDKDGAWAEPLLSPVPGTWIEEHPDDSWTAPGPEVKIFSWQELGFPSEETYRKAVKAESFNALPANDPEAGYE